MATMQQPSRTATSSTCPGASPLPRNQPVQVNTQTKVIDTVAGRILCIADVRGRLSSLNDLAREANAKAIIHTGDFGFFEASSLGRINDRTLRHLTMYSPLIPNAQRSSLLASDTHSTTIRNAMTVSLLSEFPLLLSGQIKLNIPVFTVWGACEDVEVLEKFRQGIYDIENLHVLDEATTRCLDIGGVKLRLLGLGGAFVPHKMFDNGDGNATIAGGQGTMWTTALQIGELVDTAQRVFDPSETRLLVTHASPGREGIIAQLALVLKADLTISAGLHFRYTSSWNEFSVQGDFEGFRHKILAGKECFDKIWENVRPQVEAVVDENQRILLEKALSVIERIPSPQTNLGPGGTATGDEPAWKNCWNWNLCDAAYGSLVLDIKEGRVNAELKSQGFNYAYRRSATTAPTPISSTTNAQSNVQAPSASNTPAPKAQISAVPRSNGPSVAPTPPPQLPKTQQPPVVASGADTPKEAAPAKTNGTATPASPVDKPELKEKQKTKKDKKKDKQERDTRDKDGTPAEGTSAPASGKATPVANAAAEPAEKTGGEWEEANPWSPSGGTDSPLSGGRDSPAGIRTPTHKKPARNPWTLFMRFSAQVTETEMRDFFGEAKGGITKVTFPNSYGKTMRTAFVEFGDEAAMKAGQSKHAEKIKDVVPYIVVADENRERDGSAFANRGRGGGRGRGVGFAARGFAAAGLTRQQSDRKAEAPSAKET